MEMLALLMGFKGGGQTTYVNRVLYGVAFHSQAAGGIHTSGAQLETLPGTLETLLTYQLALTLKM
jgi:hypothetical protein